MEHKKYSIFFSAQKLSVFDTFVRSDSIVKCRFNVLKFVHFTISSGY